MRATQSMTGVPAHMARMNATNGTKPGAAPCKPYTAAARMHNGKHRKNLQSNQSKQQIPRVAAGLHAIEADIHKMTQQVSCEMERAYNAWTHRDAMSYRQCLQEIRPALNNITSTENKMTQLLMEIKHMRVVHETMMNRHEDVLRNLIMNTKQQKTDCMMWLGDTLINQDMVV